ncbi:DUF4179 domain-containing protein [Cohnella herbarum]|uniref:DUF4179 domain-containing protein n=1 Tax=Cohnella herbarum TaxID=2728023 RepID=A0A7Z2ZQ43_9BACL|nr:DUF4179 domain-containing protein [Cohnella herbarum]QJD87829.1 DUF4179 domain-containing protein [Cohnella herbarum]
MSSNELDLLLRDGGLAKSSLLPSIVTKRIEETLHSLPARSTLERRTKRLRAYAITAASIAVVGGAFASYVVFSRDQPTDMAILPQRSATEHQSETVRTPVIGSLLDDSDMEKNGPSVTDQGITLMIRDVTYDGYEMAIRYSVKADKEIDGYYMDAVLAMDNREIGKVGYVNSKEQNQLNHRYEKFDSDRYEGAINTWKLGYSDYRPKSFRLKVNATNIGGQAGQWSLDIPVSRTPDIIEINPDLTKKDDVGTLAIDRIVLSKLSMQLHYRFEHNGPDDESWLGVEVTDEQGYHYGSHVSRSDHDLGYMDLIPVTNGAKTLIVRPFYDDDRNNINIELADLYHTSMLRQPTEDEPLILPMGEAGDLKITKIEYLADKTVVYTKDPIPSGSGFAIQDENGNLVPIITLAIDGETEFKPIPKDARLTFLTRPTFPRIYIPELEVRVDLPQR